MISCNVVKSLSTKLIPFFQTIVLYFITFPFLNDSPIIGTIVKCLPILTLMVFVLHYGTKVENRVHYSKKILVGLFFCCMGDAFLVWGDYFEAGMVAFTIGHLNYIFAFGLVPMNVNLGIIVCAFEIAGIIYLLPGIKEPVLKFGVPLYIFILGKMLWRALSQINSREDLRTWNKMSSCIGGLLFVLSDFILGVNMFKFQVAYAQVLVMSSYYLAQLGIALSVIEFKD